MWRLKPGVPGLRKYMSDQAIAYAAALGSGWTKFYEPCDEPSLTDASTKHNSSPMERDASAWLDRHRPGRFVPDRTCPLPNIEKFTPGDVNESGSILSATGIWINAGYIWLTERKARAAQYYGWRLHCRVLCHDEETGDMLYHMWR